MRLYKFILAVQGEGRGHLTQAMAIYELLQKAGHTISCVTVGTSGERQIPEFFTRKINVPVIQLASPNFVKDKYNRSLSLFKTVSINLKMLSAYKESLGTIKKLTGEYKPDILINFYEPLIGWFAFFHKPAFRIVSIAHQYTYLHSAYNFPAGNVFQSALLKYFTRFTAAGSHKILAINMHDLPADNNKKLQVIPPVLRHELFEQKLGHENFILVYLLNSGYIQDILAWHKKHPGLMLYCFTDNANVKEKHKGVWNVDKTLVFYSLNDRKFLELMARCQGLVCNAGFESVCEAMWLGKPVMMVPVNGHFEQYCNARDATRIGAGIHASEFNLEKMEYYLLFHKRRKNEIYRSWVSRMDKIVLQVIDDLMMDKGTIHHHGEHRTGNDAVTFNPQLPTVN
jgi:uncharacterized protein (TIGR00661 family)